METLAEGRTLAGGGCDFDCPGYYQDPKPCDLWPGEARNVGRCYDCNERDGAPCPSCGKFVCDECAEKPYAFCCGRARPERHPWGAAMKFEKIKPGMTLYDVHSYQMGNTTIRSMGCWEVAVDSVDPAKRTAVVRLQGVRTRQPVRRMPQA